MTLPQYILSRLRLRLSGRGRLAQVLQAIPTLSEALFDINLAVFYLFGRYYDITHRVFRMRRVRLAPFDLKLPLVLHSSLATDFVYTG